MSFTYGFYNSKNHDRTYNAEQMSSIFDGLIEDGIYESIGGAFLVKSYNDSMQVQVSSGRAWFNHTWSYNDQTIMLTVEDADALYSRIDAVVLEVNADDTVRANSIKIVKGTPASSPMKPELINSEYIHQHPLAYISLKPGVTKITQSMIENAVGGETPFVKTAMKMVSLSDLQAQYDSQFTDLMSERRTGFDSWFSNIQNVLDDDAAANIVNKITISEDTLKEFRSLGFSGSDPKLTDLLQFLASRSKSGIIQKINVQIDSTTAVDDPTYASQGYIKHIDIAIEECTVNYLPDIYLGTVDGRHIASICESGNGYVRIFTDGINFGKITIPSIRLTKSN